MLYAQLSPPAVINKVSELERDADEHTLVLETLRQVNEEDPDRKCFRMIGGVLVQRTVKDILPQLQTNFQGIQSVIEQLSLTYKKREEGMSKPVTTLGRFAERTVSQNSKASPNVIISWSKGHDG
ncbi:MAG: hypothetical protein CYPHOPRED_000877 [Cyphobasidiales sp. Tagirdzhanova-0007]|nr:MAG: hypothetical protein CYPHOPRED_000877 [Cyphobasidiales sp. Tagirdzhanova-0007]